MPDRLRARRADPPELLDLRRRIDELDAQIVGLLNERARLGLEIGRAKEAVGGAVRDGEREREVLMRVALANEGPMPLADLLAVYRRLVRATRQLEEHERRRESRPVDGGT